MQPDTATRGGGGPLTSSGLISIRPLAAYSTRGFGSLLARYSTSGFRRVPVGYQRHQRVGLESGPLAERSGRLRDVVPRQGHHVVSV